jgi:membrane protein DedA with SNARE-associated domain
LDEQGSTAVVESFNAMLPALLAYSPYLAIFTLLLVGIWLVPFAEEVALTSAGYLYFVGEVHLAAVLGVAGIGVFLGDFVAFALGCGWGGQRWRQLLIRRAHHSWFTTVGTFIDWYGPRALFWSRFLPGVRLPAHFLAGLGRMPVATYMCVSLLSVVVYVPMLFMLAYSFGEEIETVLPVFHRVSNLAWVLFCVGLGVWGLCRFWLTRLLVTSRHKRVA